MPPCVRRTLAAFLACFGVCLGMFQGAAAGSEFTEGFDGPRPSWKVRFDRSRVRLAGQRRQQQVLRSGTHAESLQFLAAGVGQTVQLEHEVPSARVLDDVAASLWLKSNRANIRLWLQVVFPNQRDPRSGNVLTTWIPGTVYGRVGEWERLQCTTDERAVRKELQLLRGRLNDPRLDLTERYIDRVIVTIDLEAGPTDVVLDDLSFGPVVSPEKTLSVRVASAESDTTPVSFNLGRLSVAGRPFLMRVLPYHGESIDTLSRAGVNVVWVHRMHDVDLMNRLRVQDIWSVAVPPVAASADGSLLAPDDAGLAPFDEATLPILGWYVGTRIPAEAHRDVKGRCRQIRGADRRYRRPLLGDVTGAETDYSREFSMLGVSRHVLHTTFSFRQLRDWYLARRSSAQPGQYLWTWVQTEPVSANAEWRTQAKREPIVVEPEQIRLQVYAALSAGFRGIGYWKTTSLDHQKPGMDERRLIISQLNLELDMLDEWLAAGDRVGNVRLTVSPEVQQRIGSSPISFRNRSRQQQQALARVREQRELEQKQEHAVLEAAMIRSDRGLLLLPVFYEHLSQFVPGKMVVSEAQVVVPGVEDTASAYEVTTTGIHSLEAQRATGGMRVTLKNFDQTTAIILTSDRSLKRELEAHVDRIAESSADIHVELARAKWQRVSRVVARLRDLSVSPSDAPRLLQEARAQVDRAAESYARGSFEQSRLAANLGMQILRILQRAYWEEATWRFGSPVCSPHSMCFQTLPDHWEMLEQIGRGQSTHNDNLLRSGDFEDIDTMVVEGWEHAQNPIPGVQAAVTLQSKGHEGQFALRVQALPDAKLPARGLTKTPVIVSTPTLSVREGQLLHISGWYQIRAGIVGSPDGAMIYDSIIGPAGAVRWYRPNGWQRFEMIREVVDTGPFFVTLELRGLGEILLDDLKVVPIDRAELERSATTSPVKPLPGEPGRARADANRGRFPFLNRIPGLGDRGAETSD